MNLIYNSKLKYDDIGRESRKKIWILTWDSARIDCRIKGFSFFYFEDDRRHLRKDFSLFYTWNLTFKHSLDAEIDLEEKERKRFKDGDV